MTMSRSMIRNILIGSAVAMASAQVADLNSMDLTTAEAVPTTCTAAQMTAIYNACIAECETTLNAATVDCSDVNTRHTLVKCAAQADRCDAAGTDSGVVRQAQVQRLNDVCANGQAQFVMNDVKLLFASAADVASSLAAQQQVDQLAAEVNGDVMPSANGNNWNQPSTIPARSARQMYGGAPVNQGPGAMVPPIMEGIPFDGQPGMIDSLPPVGVLPPLDAMPTGPTGRTLYQRPAVEIPTSVFDGPQPTFWGPSGSVFNDTADVFNVTMKPPTSTKKFNPGQEYPGSGNGVPTIGNGNGNRSPGVPSGWTDDNVPSKGQGNDNGNGYPTPLNGNGWGSGNGNDNSNGNGNNWGNGNGNSWGVGSGNGQGQGIGSGSDNYWGIGSGNGQGVGSGNGQGFGSGNGQGVGSGNGQGVGSGNGQGVGSGNGQGVGSGSGAGSSNGQGVGSGNGQGVGKGNGNGVPDYTWETGSGNGKGIGSGKGKGTGNGNGKGKGHGKGDGSGDGSGVGTYNANGVGTSTGTGLGTTISLGNGTKSYNTTAFKSNTTKGNGNSVARAMPAIGAALAVAIGAFFAL